MFLGYRCLFPIRTLRRFRIGHMTTLSLHFSNLFSLHPPDSMSICTMPPSPARIAKVLLETPWVIWSLTRGGGHWGWDWGFRVRIQDTDLDTGGKFHGGVPGIIKLIIKIIIFLHHFFLQIGIIFRQLFWCHLPEIKAQVIR